MAITEQDRHRMYQRLEEVLGHEEASTLMEHLPPVGWADVATKRDLDQQIAATRQDIEHLAAATARDIEQLAAGLDLRFDHFADKLRVEFHRGINRALIAVMATNTALFTAAVALMKFG
jgi:hypothetical protein